MLHIFIFLHTHLEAKMLYYYKHRVLSSKQAFLKEYELRQSKKSTKIEDSLHHEKRINSLHLATTAAALRLNKERCTLPWKPQWHSDVHG